MKKENILLIVNSAYGKTMENLSRRISVKIVNNEKDFLKYIKSTFISTKIFDKNYAAIHEIKPVLTLNKPIYVGFTVLELSKLLICSFHYSFIKKNFDAELFLTDTESSTCEIKSEDVYKDFYIDKHLVDLSNYPKDSTFFDSVNEKVIGKMKDVHQGKPIHKFLGIKSKMHSILLDDG